MNTDKLWNVRDEIVRKIVTASMKLDRLQVELSDDSPYEIPDYEEIRTRILSTMNTIERLGTCVNELAFEIKKIEA